MGGRGQTGAGRVVRIVTGIGWQAGSDAPGRASLWVKNSQRSRRVRVAVGGESLASTAGGVLLVEAVRASGLDRGLSTALSPWRKPFAVLDPGRIIADLAMAVGVGGDCLADVGVLRAQPAVFGRVASDPTVSRLIDTLAADVDRVLARLRQARADARAEAWAHRSPVPAEGRIVVDLDGSLVTAHSDKELAGPTFKRGFGFHPLFAFVDHAGGEGAGGEPLAALLRKGSANANDSADHITVLNLALAQLPETARARVLVRADSGGGTKAFLNHIVGLKDAGTDVEHAGLDLEYSVGIGTNIGVDRELLDRVLPQLWEAAYDTTGEPRDGAQVAELTGLLPDLTGRGWPAGMRVIARRERPHPGAQLRLTDYQGWRVTIFATNTTRGQLADLEVRHRARARAEDRIRCLKDTGQTNLPLHDFAQNQIWLETVLLAGELLAWTATLGLDTHRRAEPKRLRLRLFAVAARIVRTGRRTILRLPADWPWAAEIAAAHARLQALPAPR